MLSLSTPVEIARTLAQRARDQRLQRGWSQAELARRAGVKLPTYVLFERTGRISLVRFIAILDVLGLSGEIETLGKSALPAGASLAELAKPLPKRGRTRQ
ncbi:MAG TPA: helix-turn-helix transcriptional regulator [Opitutaceae bacterium]|nr:helix-turn-helix transcriptional regulator [Opitutaceae bacterium]